MIPVGYEWLGTVGVLPRMVQEALALYGVHEGLGVKNNLVILEWAHETGQEAVYTADATPWCGLFMAVVAKRAGYVAPSHPLWALNWKGFGQECRQPVLGSTLVFLREGGGHVGLYVGEDLEAYHVLGGNSRDQVMIIRIAKTRLAGAREPSYRIGRPESARPYVLRSTGSLSSNEA